tara:strand:+ start:564 stop:818 length:255 start_codon:yes stop_codon:yes gene_type:complete
MNIDEILEWCGYDSPYDMLKDTMSTEQLLNLLEIFVDEGVHTNLFAYVEEEIIDIAKKKHGWVDHEGAKADADEAAYQTYKDGD